MTDDDSKDLDRLLDLFAEESQRRPDPVEHPSAGTLSAYHARELSPEEEALVQEHLAVCARCRELLLEYKEFMAAPEEIASSEPEEAEEERERQDLRARLDRPPEKVPAPIPQRRGFQPRRWLPLAAVFATLVAGITLYNVGYLRNLETLTVMSRESPRSAGEVYKVQIPKRIVFVVPARQEYPSYEIEFRNESGEAVRFERERIEAGKLELTLRKWGLKPGLYEVDVLGKRGDDTERLATYDVRIVE